MFPLQAFFSIEIHLSEHISLNSCSVYLLDHTHHLTAAGTQSLDDPISWYKLPTELREGTRYTSIKCHYSKLALIINIKTCNHFKNTQKCLDSFTGTVHNCEKNAYLL